MTKGRAEPSSIGISGPSSVMIASAMCRPASADMRCSIVAKPVEAAALCATVVLRPLICGGKHVCCGSVERKLIVGGVGGSLERAWRSQRPEPFGAASMVSVAGVPEKRPRPVMVAGMAKCIGRAACERAITIAVAS